MMTYSILAIRQAFAPHEAARHREGHWPWARLSFLICCLLLNVLAIEPLSAQIKIGGNVYGGGNKGNVNGSTKVHVRAGDIGAPADPEASRPLADPKGKVFGGARMANVGGNTFVHIDGEHASDYIVINQVFGGNDIAGTIGTAAAVSEEKPSELTAVKRTAEDKDNVRLNDVDDSFNSYVRISTKLPDTPVYYTVEEIAAAANDPEADAYGKTTSDIKPAANAKKIYIGQLFGGGNGEYDYVHSTPVDGKVTTTVYKTSDDSHTTPVAQTQMAEGSFQLPVLNKTYLEVLGGSIVYAYGGGNNVTVDDKTIIHVDNPSYVTNHIWTDASGVEVAEGTKGAVNLLSDNRFLEMGINNTFSLPRSGAYQVGRFFGGNNLAEMDIRPTWNLLSGKIRNLYSGGNRGAMTSPEGLLMEIQDYSTLIADNVYGGCRMADVMPSVNGEYRPTLNLTAANYPDADLAHDYNFPNELSARTLIRGGHINNVYGGNDITGTVYGGNALGIYTTVYGDVYGGGNGAYPYTDMQDDGDYCDLYYDDLEGSYETSIEKLNAFRPNAEQVSIRLAGQYTESDGVISDIKPTIIKGSVYVGGNCASLSTVKSNPLVELKIGSYVVADKVFLGNNGEKMVDPTILAKYADDSYNSLSFTDASVFSQYMEGVCMNLQPDVVFDEVANGDPVDYKDYTSYIGSFFCGGNVGSMAIPGTNTYSVSRGLNIFNKFVGGCNNANVAAADRLNAAYEGGVLGSTDERSSYIDSDGNIKDRLKIDLENLTFTPMRWNPEKTALIWNTQKWGDAIEYNAVLNNTTLTASSTYYTSDTGAGEFTAGGDEVSNGFNYYTKDYVYSAIASGNTLVKGRTYYTSATGGGTFTATGSEVATGSNYFKRVQGFVDVANNEVDINTRVMGGNAYGGCYNSGHVNGNVVININESLVKKDEVFGTASIASPTGITPTTTSGVDFDEEQIDVMVDALATFGAGYGEDTEIWGSTTVNHNNGYAFLIFGGGEQGVVGKKTAVYDDNGVFTKNIYEYNPAYSTTVNLNGTTAVHSSDGTVENLAEAEYIYGGGNEGHISGNTLVNLGKGRVYGVFGGSSNADILGHAGMYIGRQPDGNGGYKEGFPWVTANVYGGNDLGSTIHGAYEDNYDFEARIRDWSEDKKAMMRGNPTNSAPGLLKSASYVEYLVGHVDSIFGGCYGYYDYDSEIYEDAAGNKPEYSFLEHAFVNIRPNDNSYNMINGVFGAGTGYPKNRDGDNSQNHSYVLVDIPDEMKYFENMEVFGAGSYNGVGMGVDKGDLSDGTIALDEASAIIDLLHGKIGTTFGGSYNEGVTRRTVINVPEESTINLQNIFGGAYGTQILPPCDVYESQVNYSSEDARVTGAIYGGNNNERRTLFTQVNISAPVWSNKEKGYMATIYGAGRGVDTWSEHTEVNLLSGAKVYEVYGGGQMGHVLNTKSIQAYMQMYKDTPSAQVSRDDAKWRQAARWESGVAGNGELNVAYRAEWHEDWTDAWTLGTYYVPDEGYDNYADNEATNLSTIANRAELDDKTAALLDGKKYNTNVIINEGAEVVGYAYGGGLGDASVALSGDVYGTTYIALLGGTVKKDVYAAGKAGGLDNLFDTNHFYGGEAFTANSNAYIKGGTCRNVYGGGYLGNVGYHTGGLSGNPSSDRAAEAHVVIGDVGGSSFTSGVPAIQRNVYGGGEGGSVYGSSHVTMNNGYVGYRYKNTGTKDSPVYEYVEELDDQKTNDLDLCGNIFGGGYVINSYVDNTNIDMFGGTVRGSLYGGGEIGPIGRGTVQDVEKPAFAVKNQDATIYKAGHTHIRMFNGHVMRNVFGGGRGKDSWGGDGTMYMDKDLVATLDMKSKGYVFGQTDVNIYGGEIGTAAGLARNFGNVFGGCDEGSVYSAYANSDGALFYGQKSGERYNGNDEGYYYKSNKSDKFVDDAGNELDKGAEKYLTEDCHVLIEPWLQTKAPITYNGVEYASGDYIPTSYLNTLPKKDKNSTSWPTEWSYVDAGSLKDGVYTERGVIIHNAVFAGGNIGVGSELYANTKTVFGNASASIHDVYNRDLISIGAIHVGGLYGDGNLTFVDGYRELNVTNYGTDYYNIQEEISYSTYQNLPPREQAYYELKYKCVQQCIDNEKTTYTVGSTVPQDELLILFEGTDMITSDGTPNSAYWTANGVVSRYAGRYLNTMQRADFSGVFGSRLVMKGAKDRVPEVADNTNYTINRVREVSLNKKASIATSDAGTDYATHGNYFGIYSVVNHLGALTSDLDFHTAKRTTDNVDGSKYKAEANGVAYGTATYAQWKNAYHKDPRRNNDLSHNELALASGVYLELTTEKSTGDGLNEKDWGIITGVVQLDLINVAKGIGGGYVYAKNIHGVRESTSKTHTILTDLNKTGGVGGAAAVTNKSWKYVETDEDGVTDNSQKAWQTSGNFVHNSQVIIDDCYNVSGRYQWGDSKRVPAHYWYIRGSVYVYDQYITAHTGHPEAYSKMVEIPITISAASNNHMKLIDVQPNLYAYYSNFTNKTVLEEGKKLLINDVEYYLNTPISYWDWSQLPAQERKLFVAETYVTSAKCKIGETIYPAGMVMLPSEYTSYYNAASTQTIDGESVKVLKIVQDENGNDVVDTDNEGKPIYVAFDDVFHSSNEMSHDTGFSLTYKMTNPGLWDTWYTKANSATHEKQQTEAEGYENGPTFYLNSGSGQLLGQQEYNVADIIPESTYNAYTALGDNKPTTDDQAIFERAYVVTNECSSATRHYYEGAPVSATEAVSTGVSGNADAAYVCTGTIQLSATEYIFINDLMTEDEKEDYKDAYPDLEDEIDKLVVPAYYCKKAGLYGGTYYETGKNYRSLESFNALPAADRDKFTFNYDALDLLIDPKYSKNNNGTVIHPEGQKYQYDSAAGTLAGAEANAAHYSLATPIDYTATYDTGSLDTDGVKVDVTHSNGTKGYDVTNIVAGDVLTRAEYEKLPNNQRHYAPIDVTDDNKANPFYVVKTAFFEGEPYAAGQVIDAETYAALSDVAQENNIDALDMSKKTAGVYYYCHEAYDKVALGTLITSSEYNALTNKQKGFTIQGLAPTETTTLYVSRDANYDALTKEKIITVVYQYDYEESDESGTHITPISERHVVRIHVTFENGVPTIEDIQEPDIVLPGTSITMRVPGVTANGYEIIGGGWELFESKEDAESHFNGVEYSPSVDPLYWYQDDFYISYFAKTYNRGKTYSNNVPIHVANYHDLKEVMDDKVNHLHVDYDRTRLKRDSKIYINDYSASDENGLDLFKDLYALSVLDGSTVEKDANGLINDGGTFQGHKPLNNSVSGGDNLEFFLRSDINHSKAWTPIGSETQCFQGNLHGDGHTLKGLNNSLFANLCGNVYNLGVMGSFTGAGIAEKGSGYIENCWISTSSTAEKTAKPVLGTPTADSDIKQMVNCYYQEDDDATNKYTNHTGTNGIPTRKEAQAFYNGEVAYDLNGFYLYKRFCDPTVNSGTEAQTYKYFTVDADNTLSDAPRTKYYADNMSLGLCSSGYNGIKYVEDRFADGDYRFAAGEIPDEEDERYYEETETVGGVETVVSSGFYPIWPDDYIFFGQKLTYGWAAEAHQEVPTAVVREDGRLSLNDDANRVYRAPAYFRSKDMSVFHFNPNAYLAHMSMDGTKVAYPKMTAIDFAGHNNTNEVTGTYGLGLVAASGTLPEQFYPPLLDDDGLVSVSNCDETKNLLVYAPAETSDEGYHNQATHDVLTAYFVDPLYADHYNDDDGYRLVSECDDNIHGHLVQSDRTATNDHFLVDKQDFNAPIAYTFADNHLMWYQRTPSNKEYVDNSNKGWQGISIPFTAELVTTNQKGEITHFYSGSATSANSDNKIGHEYWLRNYAGGNVDPIETNIFLATMNYPSYGTEDKNVTNTFLWDYYYQNSYTSDDERGRDENTDRYQKYYKEDRSYSNYPLLTTATPYILGLPGATYYEFDLSGKFQPQNTYATIDKLSKQVITFASKPNAAIAVSDDELVGVTSNGYTFMPSYLNMDLAAGTNNYTLTETGDLYNKVPASGDATTVSAFRPYFTAAAGGSVKKQVASYILFSGDYGAMEEGPETALDGSIEIYAQGRNIVTKSHMKEPTTIRIVNVSGVNIANFVLEPGQTVETPVNAQGAYIVNKKKIFVKY